MASEEQKKQETEKQTETIIGEPDDGIITTEEKLEGFRIVKAILCQRLDAARVVYRDFKNYFMILLDDSLRKPLCRLYFNSPKKKWIGLFNDPANFRGSGSKTDVRVEISSIDDIYKSSSALLETASLYEQVKDDNVHQADAIPIDNEDD